MKNNFENMISRCFGIEDKKFASHPSDIERANELIKYCISNSISKSDLLYAVDSWYRKEVGYIGQDEKIQNFQNQHIKEQLKKVDDFYTKIEKKGN